MGVTGDADSHAQREHGRTRVRGGIGLGIEFFDVDVAAGEELTFFYPSTEWEMASPFICLCGAPNCIHVVAGARFLPLSTLEQHFLNRHIREAMIELLNSTELHLVSIERDRIHSEISQSNPSAA